LHRRLDAKKAGVLLYAMQVASSNLDRPSEDKSQKKGEPEGREHDDVIGDDLAAEKPGEKPEQPQLSNPEKSS
jgi:hypothetical protein